MKTILLVDDDPQLRTLLGLTLRGSGYSVIEADSGMAGLELARKHLPDLILSDIDMPGGDGASLLREVRCDPELKFRQFVLMSGRPDLIAAAQDIEEKADHFLAKPVRREELLSCLKERLGSGASWQAEDQVARPGSLLDVA
jgi:CheY-like chemotaxis protein